MLDKNKFRQILEIIDTDLLISIKNNQIVVIENGYFINNIQELKLDYSKDSVPTLDIKQII